MADQKLIATDTLYSLIAAVAQVERLPAQPWAMADAMSYVARHAPGSGSLSWLAKIINKRPGAVDKLAREAVQQLVIAGDLVPVGHGWHAGYEVSGRAHESAMHVLESLPAHDQDVIEAAGQRLVAMATIWSKKAVASRLPRSATS
jgi:hypothetical protein